MLFAFNFPNFTALKLRNELYRQIPMAQQCQQVVALNETSLPLTGSKYIWLIKG
jgi:hypothetical protein